MSICHENILCFQGQPYTATLKLSGCREGEFTCWDGQCVTMEQRCDTVSHCRDGSDEQDCTLLVLDHGYNKESSAMSSPRLFETL